MEKTVVLGFDARRPIVDQHLNWPEERRAKFLIRPETPSPISVDSAVWPVFAANPDESYPLNLWSSVSEIFTAFPRAARRLSESPAIIELAVVATDQQSLGYWQGIFLGRVKPEKDSALDITPECLGYDVADRYLVSGLSNCMLSQEELSVIRKDWSGAINIWGLFEEAEAARSFRTICDRLIPEHAPFEAYRMRRLGLMANA